jgi:hypothetical protein
MSETYLENPLFDVSALKDLQLTDRRSLIVTVLEGISQAIVLKEK